MRPLDDVRVLELGQVIAGPYGTLLLADLGAEVIKVERPQTGDSARNPEITDLGGYSGAFITLNRNKRSVVIDLKTKAGYESFSKLVRQADVVLNNYVPGVAKRLRIDHESLVAINPQIITCSISGFGENSPHAGLPSYDLVHQALSGYMLLSGREGDPPTRLGIPLADLAAGLFGAYGVLAALRTRDRTGRGEEVSISMYDCLISLLTYQATMFFASGEEPARMGSAHEFVVPWQAFQTADGHIVIAVRANHFWTAFCHAVGLEELSEDERFLDNERRLAHRSELEDLLGQHLRKRTTEEWMRSLSAWKVPSAPVRGLSEALADPHIAARQMIEEYVHPSLGRVRVVANPVRFGSTPLLEPLPPPELGADQYLLESIPETESGNSEKKRSI